MRPSALALLAALAVAGCGGGNDDGGGQAVTFAPSKPATTETRTSAPASANLFTLRVPADWTRQDSTLAGGIQRSQWSDPAAPGTSVLVDALADATSAPEERARRNRDRGAAKPGYREHKLGPVRLGGRPGFVWEYELPDRRVVDYFLNHCGDGYAVQGAAPRESFVAQAPAFRAAANSLRSTNC